MCIIIIYTGTCLFSSLFFNCLCSDDTPFSKLKITVAGSLKSLLARQQKQKEEEDKTKVATDNPQEGGQLFLKMMYIVQPSTCLTFN